MTGFGMRKFTEDFKREAVRLVQTSGRTIEQVADDLGIGRSTLGKWLAKHREADLLSGHGCKGTPWSPRKRRSVPRNRFTQAEASSEALDSLGVEWASLRLEDESIGGGSGERAPDAKTPRFWRGVKALKTRE